jgi:hypothetical protein
MNAMTFIAQQLQGRASMEKPCRLEFNAKGAWKLITRFDAADDERTDSIMNAAAELADAVNDGGRGMTLRIATDESHPDVLMRYDSKESGWRDARTGEPA